MAGGALAGIMAAMTRPVDNRGESDYHGKIAEIASVLRAWEGPIVAIAHVDPDGDALGSTLALKRALVALGKDVTLPLKPPPTSTSSCDPASCPRRSSTYPRRACWPCSTCPMPAARRARR